MAELGVLAAVGVDGAHRRRGVDEPGDLGVVLGAARRHLVLDAVVLQGRARPGRVEVARRGVEHVVPRADADGDVLLRHLEVVGALLQLPPEADVGVVAVLRHVLGRHLEGIGLHLDRLLPAVEGLAGDGVDLVDLPVGHREAAGRRAGAVHEDRAARRPLRPVVGVGIADVEGEVVLRGRVHLARRDAVEAFRHLAVALAGLGAGLPRPAAHREGLHVQVAPVRAHLPDLELGFLLVGADQHRGGGGDALLLHQRHHLGRQRVLRPRRAGHAAVAAGLRLVAAGERRRGDRDQGEAGEAGGKAVGTHTGQLC